MRNTFLDRRSQYRYREESLEDLAEEEFAADGESLLFEHIAHQEIREALDRLPVDYRTTLWLFDVEGFSQQEISVILDCAIGTVGSRLYRGRAMLRHSLIGRARSTKDQEELP